MTDRLPPILLRLFQARAPVRHLPQIDTPLEQRHTSVIDGVGEAMPAINAEIGDSMQQDDWANSWLVKKIAKKAETLERHRYLRGPGFEAWKLSVDPKALPHWESTIFVARLPYNITEKELAARFSKIGEVIAVRIVTDEFTDWSLQAAKKVIKPGKKGPVQTPKKKKPHVGYGFVTFRSERNVKVAVNQLNGMQWNNRFIVVDAVKGKHSPTFRPRKFGGTEGGRHYTKRHPYFIRGSIYGSGAPFGQGMRGGYRGGYRGGFSGGGRGSFGGPPRSNYHPSDAPSGPRGGRPWAGDSGPPLRYDDRRGAGVTGTNSEPLGGRDRGFGDRNGSRSFSDRPAYNDHHSRLPYRGDADSYGPSSRFSHSDRDRAGHSDRDRYSRSNGHSERNGYSSRDRDGDGYSERRRFDRDEDPYERRREHRGIKREHDRSDEEGPRKRFDDRRR